MSTATQNAIASPNMSLLNEAVKLGVSADDVMKRMADGETIQDIIKDQRDFLALQLEEEEAEKALARANSQNQKPVAAKPEVVKAVAPVRTNFPKGTEGEMLYLHAIIAYQQSLLTRRQAGITLKVSAGGTVRKDKNGEVKLVNGKPDVSPGGALSIYGCGQFPITVYLSSAVALFSDSQHKAVQAFIVEHFAELTQKDGVKLTLEDVKAKLAS